MNTTQNNKMKRKDKRNEIFISDLRELVGMKIVLVMLLLIEWFINGITVKILIVDSNVNNREDLNYEQY